MKKVLFLAYFFPPLGGAGVHRSLKFVKYLPQFGWLPIVISADENVNYAKDYSLLNEIPKEVQVYRVKCKTFRLLNPIRRLFTRFKLRFPFPDPYKYLIKPFYKQAKAVIERERIDLLFTTSYPYSSHLVGMRLKRKFGIPWIAEFRDAWSVNTIGNSYYRKALLPPLWAIMQVRIKRAERRIVLKADKTIVVSWQQKQELSDIHGLQDAKLEIITNGYDKADFENIQTVSPYPTRLTVVYPGSFYTGYKEIALDFLEAVERADCQVEVVFVGKSAENMKDANYDFLTCVHYLPKPKALGLAAGSDFLLAILPPEFKSTFGKLYEYLYLRKPILAICPEDGDAARLINSYQAGFVLSYDKEKMYTQLKKIFKTLQRGDRMSFPGDLQCLEQFERRELTAQLSHLFVSIT